MKREKRKRDSTFPSDERRHPFFRFFFFFDFFFFSLLGLILLREDVDTFAERANGRRCFFLSFSLFSLSLWTMGRVFFNATWSAVVLDVALMVLLLLLLHVVLLLQGSYLKKKSTLLLLLFFVIFFFFFFGRRGG